ncbi:MAG: BRO family protein [Bergeyella zoohelcum]|nr:BRO family protein [Bergeyella zoohelcum]
MKNLIIHPQFGEIRMKMKANEPWFCAKDICEVLGIEWKRSASIGHLDEDERGLMKVGSLGGMQEMVFVNESGLYTLIMRSNKPEAKKFRKWVTSEVLPAIRKYGVYSTNPQVMDKAKARAEVKQIKEMLSEVRSHLSYTDIRLVAKQCRTTEYMVEKVLRGEVKDTYMLQLLYARSTGNKILEQQFYTAKGAEELMRALVER